MITISDAIAKIKEHQIRLEEIEIKLDQALGYVLSEDVHSPIAMPPFDQSAMDGYAICGNENEFIVVDEIQAGSTPNKNLNEGEAARIFTGAMTPKGTTSIAKQEIVERNGDHIQLTEEVKNGTSIRRKGEEISPNSLALKKGTKINPAVIGFLSGIGVEKIKVYQKPRVGLIVSGDELVQAGNELKEGKIYESNSKTLQALLSQIMIESKVYFVKDNYQSTVDQIQKALTENDLVILTGGISVGDYDFVKAALEEINVEEVFYKVKQKPGKPLYFGKHGAKRIFALPGNPAAVMTCFYMYVTPMIGFMKGEGNGFLNELEANLSHDHFKKGGRAHLLKASYRNGKVDININQSSAMLSSFVDANCLVYFDETEREFKKGEQVKLFMLPQQY
jgi:molybdopterin molybdotransferase